jgi:hypothetical protein
MQERNYFLVEETRAFVSQAGGKDLYFFLDERLQGLAVLPIVLDVKKYAEIWRDANSDQHACE